MWLLISGNIPSESYRQFNIHHPICLATQISLNVLVHCWCPFMSLYPAWVQCKPCSKKLCFLCCQNVLKGWSMFATCGSISCPPEELPWWVLPWISEIEHRKISWGLIYKLGMKPLYSPETEWPFSLFLVMWYPVHLLHTQTANSLCLLIDPSGSAKEQVCASGHIHDQMPTYM